MEYGQDLQGDKISLLGYGCMRMPLTDKNAAHIDERAAFELWDYAYAHGVNYYDTAWPYHAGNSETVLGKWLKTIDRTTVKVATKMPLWEIKKSKDADHIFDRQLKKTGTDYFDFYLAHALDADKYKTMTDCGVYDFLKQKKERGSIKRLGFSFHGEQKTFDKLLANFEWDFVQIQLNYIDWDFQNSKYYYGELVRRDIPVVVMEPVRGGLLAAPCKESTEIFKAAAPDKSAASWAMRYVASLPGVMTILSGMSAQSQLQDNLTTFDNFSPLSESERAVVQDALGAYVKFSAVPCTGCRYCMDCPAGVDIPKCFELFNAHKLGEKSLKFSVNSLSAKEFPSSCTVCKKCLPKCPQSINIPSELKKMSDIIDIM
ncbi:MAG: aldo/keto reductase [Clostridiales bacterium]|jgi:predicted aldo/keto reductase-like oxidoreductase|nr:aldo/keto reductase [Clostridiales bacterium]